MNYLKFSRPLVASFSVGLLSVTSQTNVFAAPAPSAGKPAGAVQKSKPLSQSPQERLNQISATVKRVLAEEWLDEPQKILPQDAFVKDLKINADDIPMMLMSVGENFHLDIPERDYRRLRTVGQLINYIALQKGISGATVPAGGPLVKPIIPFEDAHIYLRVGKTIRQPDQLQRVNFGTLTVVSPVHRGIVAANADVLKKVRQGLGVPYREPQGKKFFDPSPLERFDVLTNVARLFVLEGKVKAGRGDQAGAVNSYLDAVQVGLDITRGGAIVSMHAGMSCETMGRQLLWKSMDSLSAQVARNASRRLQSLEASRTSYAEILEGERRLDMGDLVDSLNSAKAQKNARLVREMQKAIAEYKRFTDAVINSARKPYALRKAVGDLKTENDEAQMLVATYKDSTRSVYVSDQTQNTLLFTSLALRAYKQERRRLPQSLGELNGAYLKQSPVDPFARKGALKYKWNRRKPTQYVLYSIGPDGKDNGGKVIDNPTYGTARHVVIWDSRGDIVVGTNSQGSYFVVFGA